MLSVLASHAAAQGGPGARLGNPSTAEAETGPSAVPAPPPPSYGEEAEPGESGIPRTELDARLGILDSTWQTLALSGRINWGSFVFPFIMGGLEVGGGVIMTQVGPPLNSFAPFLLVTGGVTVLRPLVRLLVRPNATAPATHYLGMPRGTRAEALARLRYGEEQLEAYASAYSLMRVLDACLGMATGVGIAVGWFAQSGFSFTNPFSYLILLAPAASLVSGIIQIVTPSSVERRWNAYVQMRRELRKRRERGEPEGDLPVPPPPPGPSLSFGVGLGGASLFGQF